MRLIDADELIHDLEYDVELCARALDNMNMIGKERKDIQFQKNCKQNCILYISNQPTVDAVPVVHGEWIYTPTEQLGYRCSICGKGCCRFNYCPNCGADMRGEYNE